MFATSFHPSVNALPLFPGKSVDWVPVDVAAGTITDILLQAERSEDPITSEEIKTVENVNEKGKKEIYNVHNIVNPSSISWSELVARLQDIRTKSGLDKVQEISMKEWTERLVALSSSTTTSTSNLPTIPGLRLLQFFEDMAAAEAAPSETKINQAGRPKGERSKVFETAKTREISQALRECEVFNEAWLESYLRVWKERGFLSG